VARLHPSFHIKPDSQKDYPTLNICSCKSTSSPTAQAQFTVVLHPCPGPMPRRDIKPPRGVYKFSYSLHLTPPLQNEMKYLRCALRLLQKYLYYFIMVCASLRVSRETWKTISTQKEEPSDDYARVISVFKTRYLPAMAVRSSPE
jgi:hypothetical protein